ncbi:hypothetical protein C922_05636 [Plasmodium inui San Antonio 1]|uniref:Uncharacterized protein n=1 Tax=Plasmodium inui San Antonio 1 TaxID=1237626 RepID=W7A4E7_9APIC|nr:hypothetical protein C922_05636 [Plasmodium inui San Antonio 1]EUD63984.1 hypothetical protein C922_05636 [Plasmodium inui San Antonio 1]
MGISLGQYIKNLWESNESRNESLTLESGSFKLSDLNTGGRPTNIRIPDERGPSGDSGAQMGQKHIRVRAIMVCKAMEGWMSNLSPGQGNGTQWGETTCEVTDLGEPYGTRILKKCPIDNAKESWTTMTSDSPLYLQQEKHRTFQGCIDVMSIMIKVYSAYTSSKVEEARSKGSEICQQISKELQEWGGSKVEKKIMDEWFLNKGAREGGGWLKIKNGESLSRQIGKLLDKMNFQITGVQCTRTEDQEKRYEDSCVYTKGLGCEMMGGDEETMTRSSAVRNDEELRINTKEPKLNIISSRVQDLIAKLKAEEQDQQREQKINEETRVFTEEMEKRTEALARELETGNKSLIVYISVSGIILSLLGLSVLIYFKRSSRSKSSRKKQRNFPKVGENFPRNKSGRGVISYTGIEAAK